MSDKKESALEKEEQLAINKAKKTGKPVSYIAKDGCHVVAFPNGGTFYNPEDWW